MSEMVERIARAMTADHYSMRFNKPVDDDHVKMNVNSNWYMFERQARIALQAMRKPTEEMIKAIADAEAYEISDFAWAQAIGEALGEKEEHPWANI